MIRTFGLFGLTLVSYYDYERNITWGYFIGVILLFLDSIVLNIKNSNKKVSRNFFVFGVAISFVIYILLSSFIGARHNNLEIMPQRAAFSVFAILVIFVAYTYFKHGLEILLRPFTVVLIVHLLFFYIQLIAVGIFSMQLDLIEPITGEAQRIFGGSYDVGLFSQFFRPAGLFAEPGTYANMLFLIFLLREVVRNIGRPYLLEDMRDIVLAGLTVVSLILSFSIFGYIFIAVFFASVLLKSKSKGKAAIVFSAALLPFLGIAAVYVQQRFALGDQSGTGFRYEAILILFENLDWMNIAVGWGFLSDFDNFYYDITFNDLGLLFNILLQCGLLGTLLWCLFFKKFIQFNGAEFALAVSLQLTKFTLTYPIIWLALILILNAARSSKTMTSDREASRAFSDSMLMRAHRVPFRFPR